MMLRLSALVLALGLAVHAQDNRARALLDRASDEVLALADSVVGAAVVVIDGDDSYIGSYGHLSTRKEWPVTSETLFEIGSITKCFTGLLLADAVSRGEVELDTTLRALLPQEVGKSLGPAGDCTLIGLATYRSGLPRNVIPMPAKPTLTEYSAAIKAATVEGVYAALRECDPRPGAGQFLYSNGGFELLGHVLELRTGQTYAELLEERVTSRLGMDATGVRMPDPETDEHVPEGYVRIGSGELRQQPERGDDGYFVNAFSPASGEIVSSAADMAKYARALLDANAVVGDPFSRALARSIMPYTTPTTFDTSRSKIGKGMFSSSLAWNFDAIDGHAYLIKDGQTYQFQSLAVLSPTKQRAVIILSNTAGDFGPMNKVIWEIMLSD